MGYDYVYQFYDDPSFLHEAWALYGIGMLLLFTRFAVRIKTVGIRGFQGDDFFALLVVAMYTCDAATVHIVYYAGSNVEATALAAERPLSSAEIAQFEYGSKNQLVAWYSYTALIWCLKGTMLCFFSRMTIGTWHKRMVNYISILCGVTYLAVVLTITFGCFPTQLNWQVVPNPGAKCTFKMQNFLVTTVLNVITDAMILCIPLPLLWKLQIPIRKKLVIGLLLSSGIFVIIAALIRVILTLGGSPSALNINRWGVRETIVGIITVNIPILRPMFKKSFWTGGPVPPSSSLRTTVGGKSTTISGPYEMTPSVGGGRSRKSHDGSEEFIFGKDERKAQAEGSEGSVMVRTTYEISSEAAESSSSGAREGWGDRGGNTNARAYRGSEAV